MPTLRQRSDGRLFIRGYVRAAGGYCTWQVNLAGTEYIRDQQLKIGESIPVEVFSTLHQRGYLYTGQSGIDMSPIADIPVFDLEAEQDMADPSINHPLGSAEDWDIMNTLRGMRSLKGHRDAITSLSFSPDGNLLASGCEDGTIRIWDVRSGKQLHVLKKHEYRVNSVSFSHDGALLASGSYDETIRIWDTATGRPINVFEDHDVDVGVVQFSPVSRLLASGADDKTIRLWDGDNGWDSTVLSGHKGAVRCLDVSRDGRILASGSSDKSIKLWDLTRRKEMDSLLGHSKPVVGVTFSSDGKTLVSADDSSMVRIWDVAKGRQTGSIEGDFHDLSAIALDRSGSVVATGGYDHIGLWDLQTGRGLRLHAEQKETKAVSLSPDAQWLATGGDDGLIRLWPLRSS